MVLICGSMLALGVFWLVQVVDLLRRTFPDPMGRLIWLLVLIFIPGFGPFLYAFIGRKQGHMEVVTKLPPLPASRPHISPPT